MTKKRKNVKRRSSRQPLNLFSFLFLLVLLILLVAGAVTTAVYSSVIGG